MPESDALSIQLQTPVGAQQRLAERLRALRLMAGLKQSTLAARAGVSLPSLRLFENRGEISLKHLMRICHALGRLDEFERLFPPPPAATMAELELRTVAPMRKRGTR